MKKKKKWWMPVLLGCLLTAILVGMAGATPNANPLAAVAKNHAVSVYHCIPKTDSTDWWYATGGYLQCASATNCYFYCPLDPPVTGKFKVLKVKMYAYDNGAGEVCMSLYQHKPNKGSATQQSAKLCTSDSSDNPQVVTADPPDFVVRPNQDVYVSANITDVLPRLYGFSLRYVPL